MIEVHPPVLPLTPAQFQRALQTGHGRAMEVVLRHGSVLDEVRVQEPRWMEAEARSDASREIRECVMEPDAA